jgi:hypothetical protein
MPLRAAAGENDPELIAWALGHAQQRWDDLHRAGLDLSPFVESFNCRSRDELLNVEEFGSLTEAKVLANEWGSGQFHVKK